MAGARNAVKILPGTRFIHKWPTSFTKTNVEARKHRAVLLDSHLTAMLESSSFGHHCFLHRNNPAWLLTASDYPNSGLLSGKTWFLQHVLLRGHWYNSILTPKLNKTLNFARESTVIQWPSTPSIFPQIQPHPSAKSQPEPLVPGFTLDHRHRPGLRVADGAHVSCCAQHVAEHVLEDKVCLCPKFF